MSKYYSYKKETFTCNHCGWKGLGSDVTSGEMYDGFFEIHCPKCDKILSELVSFPTHEEVLKYGSEEDKARVKKRMAFEEKMEKSELKDISQLPDLSGNSLTFELREMEENGEKYMEIIEISGSGQFVWREVLGYEYYKRFIALGELLRQKYGKRMIDFIPPVSGYYLYGDSCSASDQIRAYRRKLRGLPE
jgi:hypothetical protein